MKKTALSLVALVALSGVANAKPANELTTLKAQMAEMSKKIEALEAAKATAGESEVATTDDIAGIETQITGLKNDMKKGVQVSSKALKLDFSGEHYLGFVSKDDKIKNDRTNKFELRRNYLQTKAYFKENPKDFLRVTLDSTVSSEGYSNAIVKYAYLYLDEIFPYTGVEIGQAHRPWIDYEEHNSWNYRSIGKVFVEDSGHGPDFTNSADLGFNFKTKTPYFSSELGLFNGEGYHGKVDGQGLSAEWRLTGHLLGTGKEKVNEDLQYANVSFFGQRNQNNVSKGAPIAGGNFDDFNWYGFHAVYNQPEFLLAAQYVKTQNAKVALAGDGYSVNGELRLIPEINLVGQYNKYSYDNGMDKKGWLAGVAYPYNKNVTFIASYLSDKTNYPSDTTKNADTNSIMATAEVKW